MAFLQNQQNRKNQRIAIIMTMHTQKLKNYANFMISNEFPPVWDQLQLSSSIHLELTPQQRQKKMRKS